MCLHITLKCLLELDSLISTTDKYYENYMFVGDIENGNLYHCRSNKVEHGR